MSARRIGSLDTARCAIDVIHGASLFSFEGCRMGTARTVPLPRLFLNMERRYIALGLGRVRIAPRFLFKRTRILNPDTKSDTRPPLHYTTSTSVRALRGSMVYSSRSVPGIASPVRPGFDGCSPRLPGETAVTGEITMSIPGRLGAQLSALRSAGSPRCARRRGEARHFS